MKKSISATAIANAVNQTAQKKSDLTAVRQNVVAEVKTTKEPVEKRVSKIGSYVKPSEKEAFINLLGRKSESDAVRDLILEFIKKSKM